MSIRGTLLVLSIGFALTSAGTTQAQGGLEMFTPRLRADAGSGNSLGCAMVNGSHRAVIVTMELIGLTGGGSMGATT